MAYLMFARPGNLAGDAALAYRAFTTLASVTFVLYLAWRFHGIIPAAAALVAFRIAEPDTPAFAAVAERQFDTIFLGTLAVGVAAGTRQGRGGRLPWLLIGIAAFGITLFGWYGLKLPESEDWIARDRLRHVTLGLAVLAAIVGLSSGGGTWPHRLGLVGLTIGPPIIGAVAIRLQTGHWPGFLEGGEWASLIAEWRVASSTGTWADGAWAWSLPWVVAPLLLIGLWRTVMRGFKERKLGRPPVAWLMGAASLGTFAALGARNLAPGSMALAAVGALLSVFGVADLIQALVERIELRPPDPGPSNIPRVK
jgi:hypothetical protein